MIKRKYFSYSELKNSIFAKNLFSLVEFNSALIKSLQEESIHEHLRLFYDDKGFINADYLISRKFAYLYSKRPSVQIPTFYNEWLDIKKPALLFGIGLGYGLKYLLDQSSIPKIYVYERDKSLLKIALTLNDYASQIVANRLVIVPQEEIFTLAGKGIEAILPEPLLLIENQLEYLTISRMINNGEISSKRAVFFKGTLYVLDCATTLFDQGWDVLEIDQSVLSLQKIQQLLDVLKPELVFQINYLNKIEQISHERAVVVWHIDPIASPIPEVEPSQVNNLYIFTHNPEHLLESQDLGYKHFDYLPLCAVTHKFYPRKLDSRIQKRFGCDVSFVGSLMFENQHRLLTTLFNALEILKKEQNEAWGIIHEWITQIISAPLVGSKDYRIIEELQDILKTHDLPDVIKINDSDIYVAAPVEEFLAYLWRKQVISALVPGGIHIWGTDEWKPDFPQNYRGTADHYLDLPKIYIASKINLDISRINQPNIITMRVFDILACGGFVLADRNESLLEFFKENWDIVCYDTAEEAVDKSNYYLNHESDRIRISQRGYQKVVNSHTFVHRINHILTKTGQKNQRQYSVNSN